MVIEEDVWSEMIHLYSFEGGNKTLQEVANQYELPRKDLEIAFRLGGVFKRSPAWSREAIEEADGPELALMGRATYEAKLRSYGEFSVRNQLREQRKELETLRARDYNRLELARVFSEAQAEIEIRPKAPPKPILTKKRGTDNFTVHATTADAHCGLQVWDREAWTGKDYDLDIGAQRLREHAERTVEWIASQDGRCEVCYLSDIGDLFHATPQNKTASGKVSLQVDGRSRKIWEMVLEARVDAIESLRRVSKRIEVRQCPGNHEAEIAYFLQDALRLHYRNAGDVEVFNTVNDQDGFRVGETYHLLTHGTRIGVLSHRAKASFEVMARETAGEDYKEVRHIVCYFGHLHSPALEMQGRHLEMIRLPALAEPDEYAQSLHFTHNAEARIFKLDKRGRIELEKRLDFD